MTEPIKEWLIQEELEKELIRAGVDLAEDRKNRNIRRVLYYYRYKGLITPPIRKMVGKKLTLFYNNAVVGELQTIKQLKEEGKSLDDIAQYMGKLVKSEFVSSVCESVREIEQRYSIEPDTGMVVLSSLSKDGQFIYIKTQKEKVKTVYELLEAIGFESVTITNEDVGKTSK